MKYTMSLFSRRNFIKASAVATLTSISGLSSPNVIGAASRKVVIVGGGAAGATAAKYIKLINSSIDVTLIEANKTYYSCCMSNEVLSGEREINSIKFDYTGLKKHGVNVVNDTVSAIDSSKQTVTTSSGISFSYDRCIVCPGIDFRWDSIQGYDAKEAEVTPHAWKDGSQTTLLRQQLQAMPDGGTVIIAPPANPFRCPPAPAERISQIAYYLKQNKPKSKILAFDPKPKFAQSSLFMEGWERHYGFSKGTQSAGLIAYTSEDGISAYDAKNKTIITQSGNKIKGDVVNIIPPQKAGKIAFTAGLCNDSGWCPVEGNTFESTLHKNIHVIGDSSISSPIPKSAFAANSEAKVCAAAIVALLNDEPVPQPTYINSCYSLIAPEDAVSVAMVYTYKSDKIVTVRGSGGSTPLSYNAKFRAREAAYAHSWFNNISDDIFG
jgi:sulfide dehydrogenase [flavocytochrome c] flavoprotein chain